MQVQNKGKTNKNRGKIEDTFRDLHVDLSKLPRYEGAEKFSKNLVVHKKNDGFYYIKSDTGSASMINQ